MHVFVISIILVCVLSLEIDNYDSVPRGFIVANIKKRDTIPLQAGNRRFLDNKNLNYRRTKDIRETSVDRHFEITEALLREAQIEEQLNEMNEMKEGETTQRQGDDIRDEIGDEVIEEIRDELKDETDTIDKRESFRNVEPMDSELRKNDDKKIKSNYDNKDRIDKVQREMSWLTIDTEDGVGIDI